MAKILAISSQVVYGPVGLSAIVPALQAQGHDVLAIPTVLLSYHPGHGVPARCSIDVAALMGAVETIGAFKNIDAVITGYFASADQVIETAALIKKLRPKIILVDPVIGDHGRLYVKEEVALAIREHLLPLATIITPNAFELSWLIGKATTDFAADAKLLKVAEVIVTSVPADEQLATLRVTSTEAQWHHTQKRQNVPNGTGDYLSGLYLGRIFNMPHETAFADAMDALENAIEKSGTSKVLVVA